MYWSRLVAKMRICDPYLDENVDLAVIRRNEGHTIVVCEYPFVYNILSCKNINEF